MVSRRAPTAHIEVLQELRRAIVAGELRPGDQLFADDIAERMGMSRIPVREALRILEGEEQVVYLPHRGYFVAELTLADLLELYKIRHLLEADALRQAVPLYEDADFERMEGALEELAQAHTAEDIFWHVAANRRFHFAFWERIESPRMQRMLVQLYGACDPYGSLYYNEASNRKRSDREHKQMLRAARSRDADELVELLWAHREHVVASLEGVLTDEAEHRRSDGRAEDGGRKRRRRAHDASPTAS